MDLDFEHSGEWSFLVARFVLNRDGKLVEGVMTAILQAHRSGWRIRAQIFDAPEKAASSNQ